MTPPSPSRHWMSTGACASASIAWRRRVQRLQRELGEVWEDMRRLLDPGAVVALEEFHAVTPGGGDKAVDISREFFTSGEAGEYVLVRDFNAAAKRAGADTTVVSLESLGYTKRQKKIEGKNRIRHPGYPPSLRGSRGRDWSVATPKLPRGRNSFLPSQNHAKHKTKMRPGEKVERQKRKHRYSGGALPNSYHSVELGYSRP